MYRIFYLNHSFELNPKGGEEYDVILNTYDKEWAFMLMETLDKKEGPIRVAFGSEKAWEQFVDNFTLVIAGGGVVRKKSGKILFIKRLGKWDLPKGKLEKGEDIETCAIREVEEECNISGLKILEKLEPSYHIYFRKTWKIKKSQWYLMKASETKEAKPQKKEGITDLKWMKPGKYNSPELDTFPTIRYVLRQL